MKYQQQQKPIVSTRYDAQQIAESTSEECLSKLILFLPQPLTVLILVLSILVSSTGKNPEIEICIICLNKVVTCVTGEVKEMLSN